MASEAALPAHTVTLLRSLLSPSPSRVPREKPRGRLPTASGQHNQDGNGRILWGLLNGWWPREPRHPQAVETQGSAACCSPFPCRSLADGGSGAEPPIPCTLERLDVTLQLCFVWDKG